MLGALRPGEELRPSALHLHGHGAHLVGLGGRDGEQAIAVDGLELLALDGDREAEAAAPGAVAELAQQRSLLRRVGLVGLGSSFGGGVSFRSGSGELALAAALGADQQGGVGLK